MTREEFTVFINSLEKKYPVNKWEIDGVKLWPLIKIKLSFTFHATSKPVVKDDPSTIKFTFKIKKAFIGLFQLLGIILKKKSQTPTKLFCLAPHFRFYDGSRYVNRYFNQLITQTKNEGFDFLIGEYGNTTKEYREKLDFPQDTIFFENLKYLSLLLREFSWKKHTKRTDWPRYDELLEELKANLNIKIVSKEAIIKQFVYIQILKKFYKIVLKKYNVNEAYILCYYVSEMYAMNLATFDLDIESWDMQHGGQGSLHIAYANFNVIPNTGYKLLPRKFWTWDTASTSEINKWIRNQGYHQTEEKGNPWIEYCIQRYTAEIDTAKKIILYTMQPVGEHLLEPFLIGTIKKTPPDYIWWLRLHPRQLQQKDELKNLLVKFNLLDRVNIEEAIKLPLPGILSRAHIHISKFSGSILEAYMMQVRTIILDNIGIESFPEVINSKYGIINLDKNTEALLTQITGPHPE